MYTDFRELVLATRQKYEHATALSKGEMGPTYAHEINGIGCAIGCHLPPDDAAFLDTVGKIGEQYQIIETVLRDHAAANLVYQVISDLISPSLLAELQVAHDNAGSVDDFVERLDYYLAEGKWPDAA